MNLRIAVLAVGTFAAAALAQGPITSEGPTNGLPGWAYNVPEKVQPKVPEAKGTVRMPGSSKEYDASTTEGVATPPDWYPEEHGPAPRVVTGAAGANIMACGSCHMMSGQGHPESADLAGLPADYIVRQMAFFRSGARIDPARMNIVAKATSEEDVRQAAEYFSKLKPGPWAKIVETETVPKTYVSNKGRMRLTAPEGGMEPIGHRIIALAQDATRTQNRDPHSPFIDYVPPGSIAKGQALVKTGGNGKTIQCAICHGDTLQGLGMVPRIAGTQPVYIARQLLDIQNGKSAGKSVELMKKVVANLTEDDVIAIASYVGSLAP